LLEQVVTAAWLVGSRRLVRRFAFGDGLLEFRVNLGRIIDIGNPQVRPARVDEQAVVGAREPRRNDFDIAAGVSLPTFAVLVSDDRARMF
jgi:hypothetical protein